MNLIDKNDAKAFALGFVLCYIANMIGYIWFHQFEQIGMWAFVMIIPSLIVGEIVMILRLMNEHGKTL